MARYFSVVTCLDLDSSWAVILPSSDSIGDVHHRKLIVVDDGNLSNPTQRM